MIRKKQLILSWCLLFWPLSIGIFDAIPVSAQKPPSASKAEQAKTLIVKIRAKNSFGAGILFSLRGGYLFIATANHVIQGSPKELEELSVEFEFLRGATVQAEFVNAYPKLDLAVLRVDIQSSRLRDAAVAALPFDLLGKTLTLQRGDQVYPIGHPEGEDWDVPATPAVIKKVVAEEISFEPACFAGHSGGGLFDANWTLVGMMTHVLGRSCEAISFERICATLEGDWGLVVNHEPLPLNATSPLQIPIPTMIIAAPTPVPTSISTVRPSALPTVTPILDPKNPPHFILRSSPLTVSDADIEKEFGVGANWRPLKYVDNDFEEQGKIIIDHAIGLMWQQSGSDTSLTYETAQAYIQILNRQKFARYADWRLPTMPELMSLLERQISSNGLHIHPLFDKEQWWCWSADSRSSGSAWFVNFVSGNVRWRDLVKDGYVRAVRSRP